MVLLLLLFRLLRSKEPGMTSGEGDDGQDPFHGHMVNAAKANLGPLMSVSWRGQRHSMVDGCGLNSPSRWRPAQRGLGLDSDKATMVGMLATRLKRAVREMIGDTKRAFFRLASGRMEGPPFSEHAMNGLREDWFSVLGDTVPFCLSAVGQGHG